MPVKVLGKDLPMGKYNFVRYMTLNGEKVKKSSYNIEKTKDSYILFNSDLNIDDEIRRIELRKKGGLALMWSTKSRLGLLYTIENYVEED